MLKLFFCADPWGPIRQRWKQEAIRVGDGLSFVHGWQDDGFHSSNVEIAALSAECLLLSAPQENRMKVLPVPTSLRKTTVFPR